MLVISRQDAASLAIGPLPVMVADASTMRQLTLTGDYMADVSLELPSRLHFRLYDGQAADTNLKTRMGAALYGDSL